MKIHANLGTVSVTEVKNCPEESMDTQIEAIFCLSDDMLKEIYHRVDPQCQMNDAEKMTMAIHGILAA